MAYTFLSLGKILTMAEAKIKIMDLLGPLDLDPQQDNTDSLIPAPNKELEDLRLQVDLLDDSVSHLVETLHTRLETDRKPLLKPRDITIFELRHLRGDEGDGRLGVFFSQVEQCSQNWEERQRIVMSRVDAHLAIYIQDLLTNGPTLSWGDFKSHLRKELTDPNPNKLFDALNTLKYSYEEDPVEFMNQLKCKYSLLSLKMNPKEAPKKEKLIKTKLLKGMPKDCRERLELFMDENVSLERFLDKLEVERVVANARSKEEIFLVKDHPATTPQTPLNPTPSTLPPLDTRVDTLEKKIKQWNRPQRQTQTWGERQPYCPYYRSRTHNMSTCRRNPPRGSCFDCLRMNCR